MYVARKLKKRGILIGIDEYRIFSACFEEFIKNEAEIKTESSISLDDVELY